MNTSSTQTSPPDFLHVRPQHGQLFDFTADHYPTLVSGWNGAELALKADASHFGFVGSDSAVLTCDSGRFSLRAGMYFAVSGAATVNGAGYGFVASMDSYQGLFQIGGPVESTGRLRYIDGCSDTVLVAPPVQGDPCLNLLHIPPLTDQTAHTHPSLRVGMVLDGSGHCRTPGGDVALSAGLVFAIPTESLHSFHTTSDALRIVAWHPDSDCGPTHEQHPMLNRTYVNGRPVNAAGDHQ